MRYTTSIGAEMEKDMILLKSPDGTSEMHLTRVAIVRICYPLLRELELLGTYLINSHQFPEAGLPLPGISQDLYDYLALHATLGKH
jgi:hypothetical protein